MNHIEKRTQNERKAFDALEVGVLDGHNLGVGEELFGIVVDQLAVDEHVAVVRQDLVNLKNLSSKITLRQNSHLLFHLELLRSLEFGNLGDGVNANARSEHLHLVGVHGRVCNENLGLLHAARLIHAR